jgi:hypothetical protein
MEQTDRTAASPRDETARKRGLLAIAADHWSAGAVTDVEFAKQVVRRRIQAAENRAGGETYKHSVTPLRSAGARADAQPPVW